MRHQYRSSVFHKIALIWKSVPKAYFIFGSQSQKLCMSSFDFHVKTETTNQNYIVSGNWESIFLKVDDLQIF